MWHGYYEQYGKQHEMKFNNFITNRKPGGSISGGGTDDAGLFQFHGSFSGDASKVKFEKKYQKHSIYYEGDVQANPPVITGWWGAWPGQHDGKFRIEYK